VLGALSGLAIIVSAAMHAQQTKEAPPDPGFTFKSAVNEVVVPVVVTDSHGRAVSDLKKEDFQVFDRNKQQTVTGFTVQKRAATEDNVNVAEPTAARPTQAATFPDHFIVFLFDDLHLGVEELAQVQKAATRMLSDSLAPTDMAAVVSLSGTNTGITRDRGVLQQAITKLHTRGLYQQVESDCPHVDYYQADLIENKHNSSALEAAIQSAQSCARFDSRNIAEAVVEAAVRQALLIGDQDVRVTLRGIGEFVRRMALLPGQRTLIVISPGFLTMGQEAMIDKSRIMDMAAQANVTISTLDARGLYTTELDASQRGAGSAHALVTGSMSEYHRSSMTLNEAVMAELADGTGGTFFHNSNDLEGGFKRLTLSPECIYLLEFSSRDVKPDGSYHDLKVKIDRDGLKLQARRGYFAAKPAKKKK
jgi:VWFA-related protein